jgi:uridine kinase
MSHYVFAELAQAVESIKKSWKKLLYIAGASASGKTYIAEEIAKMLEADGKSVITISSDNYYLSDTGIKSVIYGTFDHPWLIDYALLAQNIDEYFTTGSFQLPLYSFAESRRTGFQEITKKADYVIVEWLYTISQLPTAYDPFKIYIHATEEDLIIRRLLRDPSRVWEPLHMIVTALNNVFPMRNLYGSSQASNNDITIVNDYDLLAKDGKQTFYEPLNGTSLDGKVEYNNESIIEYRYNDSTPDAVGKLLITEHYENGYLKSVGVSKTQSTTYGKPETIKHISMRVYKPGVLTQIHNLVQNAWLTYEWLTSFGQVTYVGENNKQYIVEDRPQGKYIRYEV